MFRFHGISPTFPPSRPFAPGQEIYAPLGSVVRLLTGLGCRRVCVREPTAIAVAKGKATKQMNCHGSHRKSAEGRGGWGRGRRRFNRLRGKGCPAVLALFPPILRRSHLGALGDPRFACSGRSLGANYGEVIRLVAGFSMMLQPMLHLLVARFLPASTASTAARRSRP